jgi:transglutaminase-like putative cysteine protease
MSLWRGQHSSIATAPLFGASVALALAAVPLLDRVAPWAVAIFAAALLLRVLVNLRHLRLPSLPVKLLLLALGLGGIALTYGGFIGIEPALGVLLILLSLKLLETNTVRDFQVLALLGWFLCLCGLFFSQELSRWLYLSAVALLLGASLVRFHQAPERGSFRRSLWLAGKLLVQALPIVALLFLFFPRSHANYLLQLGRTTTGVTGMTDRLEPGSFATLTQSNKIAFFARFPDRNVPALPQLYWRGGVLWRGDGLTWVRDVPTTRERLTGQLEGAPIRQNIVLQPHGGRWLFGLDRPAPVEVRDATYEAGGYFQSQRTVTSPLRYAVTSRPENRETTLLPEHRFKATRKPASISPDVQQLVDLWRASATSDRDVIDVALRFFRREKFSYSLEPQTYGEDALTEFLFERRSGFCEHYAAAFATLMRIAGIPARIVIGYHGGDVDPRGKVVIVRQLDAHAWAEVWIKGEGWQRVDPTAVIAPDRISSGSQSFLDSRELADAAGAGAVSAGATGLREILRDVRRVWDNLSYQWDLRILNYDDEAQEGFMRFIELGDPRPSVLVVWLMLAVLVVFALIAFWVGRPRRAPADPVVRDWRRFCHALAGAGIAREPWEGPQHFSERAALALPRRAAAIREAAGHYMAARYGQKRGAGEAFRRAVRTFRMAKG